MGSGWHSVGMDINEDDARDSQDCIALAGETPCVREDHGIQIFMPTEVVTKAISAIVAIFAVTAVASLVSALACALIFLWR